jgi:hypothetical protein
MIKAEYWDPEADSQVTAWIAGEGEMPGLLDAVLMVRGGRGHPALQLTRPDGSSLSLATDGTRCAMVWINSLEESFHSSGERPGPALVYDYNGSWSEAPAGWTVSIPEALGCARKFIQHGAPDTASVLFAPD